MATFIVVVAARLSGGRHREFRTLAGGALDASIFPPAFVNSTLADVNTTMLFFVDTPNDAIVMLVLCMVLFNNKLYFCGRLARSRLA